MLMNEELYGATRDLPSRLSEPDFLKAGPGGDRGEYRFISPSELWMALSMLLSVLLRPPRTLLLSQGKEAGPSSSGL